MQKNDLKKILLPKISKFRSTDKSFIELLNSRKKVVVFSSHFDDAILSMGSILNHFVRKKIEVQIINIFTKGSALDSKSTKIILARAHQTDPIVYFEKRRKEDQRAFNLIGINNINNLDFVDAAFRKNELGLPIYPNNQVGIANKDSKAFVGLIKQTVKELNIDYLKSQIFLPLALGRHVDHVLTRNVGLGIFEKVIFYQDFPYSVSYKNKRDVNKRYENTAQDAHHQDESDFILKHKLTGFEWFGDYDIKKKAILMYKTQLEGLFRNGPLELSPEKFYLAK